MIAIKGMEIPTDCKKCPLMGTDGIDKFSPMMCIEIWATKREIKHCVEGKILDDCPLEEVITCKHNDEGTCYIDGFDDYFCSSAERKE